MGDTEQQRQESINPNSRQYRINHQDWKKSKAQVPGFEEDRSPPRGRGRGWRTRGRNIPTVGTTQTGKKTSGEESSQSSGKDAKRETPRTRKDEKRLTDGRMADDEMMQEQKEQDWKIQVERRREDERRWEEDRGWKHGDNKRTSRRLNADGKETLRQLSADNKEPSCTEKSRKSRRAAQEVYVPRARRQAQAVYVPRTKRLQMEADEKSTETLADKEVKKKRVTREPPEKKRQVASQRQQRSSGRHETKLEKSMCKSHKSDHRLKTDKFPDTRSDVKLADKPLRTDQSQNTGVSRGKDESSDAVPRQSSDALNKQLLDCPKEQRREDILTDECFKLQEMQSVVQVMQSKVQDQCQQYSTPECLSSFTSAEKLDVNHHSVVAGPSGINVDHIDTSQEKEATCCPNLSTDEQLLSTKEGHYSNMTQETVSSREFIQQRDTAFERGFRICEPKKIDAILTSCIDCTNTDINDTSTVHIDESYDILQGETLVRKDTFEEVQVPVCDVGNDSIGRDRTMGPCPSQESCSIVACQMNIESVDIPSHSLKQCDTYISGNVEKDKDDSLKSNQDNREVEKDQECRWIEYIKEEKETVIGVRDTGLKDSDEIKDYNMMKTDAGVVSVNVTAGGECSGETDADLADDNIDKNDSERLRPNVCVDGLISNTHETMLLNANENKIEEMNKSSDYASDLTASTFEITNGSDALENVKRSMDQAVNEESEVVENGAMVTDDNRVSVVSEGAFLELDTTTSNTDRADGNMSSWVDKKYTLIPCTETDTSGDDAMQEESTEESSEAADADIEEEEEAREMLSSEENGMDAEEKVDSAGVDDDSWDAIFDESGESLKLEEVQEIAEGIGKVKVSIKKAKHDYYNYQAKDNMDYSAYEHVIEIYDFPAEFKTPDFIMAFSDFKNKGFDIKWVDDTHALAIFATPMVARDALTLLNPMFRTRPLARATRESKLKAKRCIEFLQPYKSRPETTAFAARRLVSGALGLRSRASKEQRETERKKLREAKDKKKADRQQTQDIWEGKI